MYNAIYKGIPGFFELKFNRQQDGRSWQLWDGSFYYFTQDGEKIACNVSRTTAAIATNEPPRGLEDFLRSPMMTYPLPLNLNPVMRELSFEEFKQGYGLWIKENADMITPILSGCTPGLRCEYVEMAFAIWEEELASWRTEERYQSLAKRAALWWLKNLTDSTDECVVRPLQESIVSRMLQDDLLFISNLSPRSGMPEPLIDVSQLISVPLTGIGSMFVTPYSISCGREDRSALIPHRETVYQVPLNLGVRSTLVV